MRMSPICIYAVVQNGRTNCRGAVRENRVIDIAVPVSSIKLLRIVLKVCESTVYARAATHPKEPPDEAQATRSRSTSASSGRSRTPCASRSSRSSPNASPAPTALSEELEAGPQPRRLPHASARQMRLPGAGRHGAATRRHRALLQGRARARSSATATWRRVPRSLRGGVSAATLQTFMDKAVAALEAGTIDDREDTTLTLDAAAARRARLGRGDGDHGRGDRPGPRRPAAQRQPADRAPAEEAISAVVGAAPTSRRPAPRRLDCACSARRRYSHSIVAGGFEEMSRATRLTSRISLMIRLETRSSRS